MTTRWSSRSWHTSTPQAANIPQGLHYAEQTIANGMGVGPVAANYANNSVNDPSLRPKAPFFVQEAVNAGGQVDPFGIAHQLNAQGDPDAALAVLAAARGPTPDRTRQQWMEILTEAEASRGKIDNSVTVTDEARVAAVAEIAQIADDMRREGERVKELAGDTASLIQGGAAHHLVEEYAKRADRAPPRGRRDSERRSGR